MNSQHWVKKEEHVPPFLIYSIFFQRTSCSVEELYFQDTVLDTSLLLQGLILLDLEYAQRYVTAILGYYSSLNKVFYTRTHISLD